METILKQELNIDKTNWKLVKFGDVVFEPKETMKDIVSDGIEHVVGLEHITSGDIHLRNSASIDESTTFTKKFAKGDVLFGRRRAYLKKAALAHFDGICSGDITVFRAKSNLLPELLPFIVNNDKFFDYAIQHSAGGLSPRVKFKDLANYEFLLPPKDQQVQLVELLWAMDEVIEREKEVFNSLVVNYDCLVNEIYKDNPKTIKLKDIDLDYFKGISIDENIDGDYLLAPSGAVFPGYLKIESLKKVKVENDKLLDKIILKNDILFNTGGVGTLGRSHFFNKDIQKYFCDSFVLVLRIKDQKFLSKYIYYLFQSNQIKNQIVQNTKGTTGITSISVDGILNFKIPNKKIEFQEKFVKELDLIENMKFEIEVKLQSSQSLQKSLINQVF